MTNNLRISTPSNATITVSITDPICLDYVHRIRDIIHLSITDLQHINNLCENDR